VHADEAMDYFNRGRKGSVTRKKIELFTKALELNPKMAAAYEQRGLLYYFQGKYDKVIQDYQTYLDLAPEKFEAYRMLGLGYLKNGDYEPAIAHFTRAIELQPQHPAGYAYRAEANRLCGNDEEAIRDSTAAVKLSSEVIREPGPKPIKQGPESIERWVSWTLPMPIPALLGSRTPDGPTGFDTGINTPVWKS
jgi:tetratricopeptide (TPR) repeat protein